MTPKDNFKCIWEMISIVFLRGLFASLWTTLFTTLGMNPVLLSYAKANCLYYSILTFFKSAPKTPFRFDGTKGCRCGNCQMRARE